MERIRAKTDDTDGYAKRDHHLAQAGQRIAETKQLIARQREQIATLDLTNQASEAAVLMLEALETSLHVFEHYRQLILELHLAIPSKPDSCCAGQTGMRHQGWWLMVGLAQCVGTLRNPPRFLWG
jgi:hypothetical protein